MTGEQIGGIILVVVVVLALIIVGVTLVSAKRPPIQQSRTNPQPQVQPPWVAPPAPEVPAAMRFEEATEFAPLGGICVAILIALNAIGGLIILGGGKSYVETTVFGQMANIFERTNGLLMLLVANNILGIGVLAGRRRTFTLRK